MTTLIHDTDRMSSLEIAELTGKRHDAILRDIRNLLKQGVSHHNFVETSYKQPQPRGGYKELPCFELTKKGCLILASGYDAVLREKIIDRWEQLELEKRKPQTPQTYLEALKALVSSEEEKQRLAQEKQQLEVKAEQQQATIELQEKEIKNVTKNNRFLFGYLNIISTFAMYFNSQGKRKPAICVGIFYAITFCFIVKILIYRLLPPCGVLMHPLPCEVKYNGKGQPFFCL